MRSKFLVMFTAILLFGFLVGCQQQRATEPVGENIEQSLEQSGLQNVDVEENRDQGVIRLTGEVRTEAEKQQAEQIAQQAAPGRTIANEILVRPEGQMGERTEEAQGQMDDAIESRLQAEMTKRQWNDVKADANNGVVTLTGTVASTQQKAEVEQAAQQVQGVKQVVNQLEVEQGTQQRRPAPAR